MTTSANSQGIIVQPANRYGERGVYERHGCRFVFTRDADNRFCFCIGRASADIDEAWAMGYREEIARGTYQP